MIDKNLIPIVTFMSIGVLGAILVQKYNMSLKPQNINSTTGEKIVDVTLLMPILIASSITIGGFILLYKILPKGDRTLDSADKALAGTFKSGDKLVDKINLMELIGL